MKRHILFILTIHILITTLTLADSWVLPWVANKDDAWSSVMVINNHSSEEITVTLEAVRPSGETETVTGIHIPANGQVALEAGETFIVLGSGSGYAVFITGTDLNITTAVKVVSLATDSGDSPALGYGTRVEQGATAISFQFLPFTEGGAAAPVLVNLGESTATLDLMLYAQDGSLAGSKQMTLAAKTPFADVISNMFPQSTSNSYLLVNSDLPITGMSFNFNTIREPSTMNAEAVAIEFSDEDLAALMATMETTSKACGSYVTATSSLFGAKKTDLEMGSCPTIDVDVNITNSDSFIEARFDWGDGCNNIFGVFSKGAINLNMTREGKATEAAWMKGSMEFDQYEVRYMASNFALDGYLHMEGSIWSDNFTLSGEWEGHAISPFYGVHASYKSSSYLSINKKDNYYEVYGNLSVYASQYAYFSMEGKIEHANPLKYDYHTCPWPVSGKISLMINWGYPVSGFMDFGTGDCNTAIVNIAGAQTILYLPGIYAM